MVRGTSTLNLLCNAYTGYGSWIGLATGDPGTTSTPSNEATGGTPAYARKNCTWGTTSAGANTPAAGVTIDVAAGTYTYVLLASNSTGNNMYDNNTISSVTMGAQGQIVVTPTYTQT